MPCGFPLYLHSCTADKPPFLSAPCSQTSQIIKVFSFRSLFSTLISLSVAPSFASFQLKPVQLRLMRRFGCLSSQASAFICMSAANRQRGRKSLITDACLRLLSKNLTCLTCAGYSVLLLALPDGDEDVVNGDVPLETRAPDSFEHDLFQGRKKETDGCRLSSCCTVCIWRLAREQM